jgi:plastocyanin
MRWLVSLAMILCISGQAWASELSVSLRTPNNQPIRDAVVTVYPSARTTAGAIAFPWPMRVEQRDLQFHPFVLIAPVGATVAFPNFDTVRHHVYSFSPAGPFELRLYGRDESRSVRFVNPGIIAIGCNIHDQMVAFIAVVDTPFAAKTDELGVARIAGLPPGQATMRVWHPYLRAPENKVERVVSISRGGVTAQSLQLQLQAPRLHRHVY